MIRAHEVHAIGILIKWRAFGEGNSAAAGARLARKLILVKGLLILITMPI